jgi:23S rRNA pseudouridine1911/1915/1917 synthase
MKQNSNLQFSEQPHIRQLFRLQVGAEAAGQRLDQFLSQALAGLSRTRARKIVDLGGVHLNGRRVRTCSQALAAGARVEIYTDGSPLEPFRLADHHILYRDKYLLVLNKPAGIETQPTPARYKGTIYEALLHLLGGGTGLHKPALGMVQRLDRGTSGLMVFSLHPQAHPGLSRIFLEHRVEKSYLALVATPPDPPAGEIRSLLARKHKTNKMVSVEHGGKLAVTRYATRSSANTGALVEIELQTGRSHQIRVHLAEAGSPLLGDSFYGGAMQHLGLHLGRPMLHAYSLGFAHPITQQSLSFKLPLPADMQQLKSRMFPATNV